MFPVLFFISIVIILRFFDIFQKSIGILTHLGLTGKSVTLCCLCFFHDKRKTCSPPLIREEICSLTRKKLRSAWKNNF